MAFNKPEKGPNKDWVRCNEEIRMPQVMVVKDGVNLGVMQTRDALNMAREEGLDLIEISPTSRPPVCHIKDYGKYMFDKSKKKKDNEKSSASKNKVVEFHYVISDHDLETKAKQVVGFLDKAFRVSCVVKFRNREKAHKDQGIVLLNRFVEMVSGMSKNASVETAPRYEGDTVSCRLSPKKETK